MTPVLRKKSPPVRKRISGIQRRGRGNPLNRRKKSPNYPGGHGNKNAVIIRVGNKWDTKSIVVHNLRGLTGDSLKIAKRRRRESIQRWGPEKD